MKYQPSTLFSELSSFYPFVYLFSELPDFLSFRLPFMSPSLFHPNIYLPPPFLKNFFVDNVSVLIASNVHNLDVIGGPPVFCHHRILKQWVEILIQVLTDDLNVIFIVFLYQFFFLLFLNP